LHHLDAHVHVLMWACSAFSAHWPQQARLAGYARLRFCSEATGTGTRGGRERDGEDNVEYCGGDEGSTEVRATTALRSSRMLLPCIRGPRIDSRLRSSTMDDLLECTVILNDLSDFAAMNKVYSTFFKPPQPARVAFQGVLAGGAAVEIKCTGEVAA